GFADGRMREQRGFHFGGIHVLAAADDQIAAPGMDDQAPSRVQLAEVTGAEEASLEGLLSEISAHYRRAAHEDLPGVHGHFESRKRWPGGSAVRVARTLAGGHRASLRHAPGLHHAQANLAGAFQQRPWHRASPHGDDGGRKGG